MSDYSFDSLETCDKGHTKVPQESAGMEEAFKHIFTTCDTENRNRVRVSKLIEFIAPYMPQNADEIVDLKLALDPNNTDGSIDSVTFYSVITEWTAKFEMSTSLENSFCSTVSSKNFEQMDKESSFMQSTPRPSLDKKHINEFESDFVLNLSVASLNGDANTSKDFATFIEKYKELEYCNKKLVDELNHNRALLFATDENIEQIDALKKEVKKLKCQFLQEQQAKEKLQAAFKDVEDLTDGISRAELQIVKLQKEVTLLNRDKGSLASTIKDLQTENKELENKCQILRSKSSEIEKINRKLQIEVSVQQEKIGLLEKSNLNLKDAINEKDDEIDQRGNIIQCMEVEKQQLNNLLKTSRDLLSHNTKSTASTGTPGTRFDFSKYPVNPKSLKFRTLLTNLTKSPKTPPSPFFLHYNSPNFRKTRNSPITPNLNSSSKFEDWQRISTPIETNLQPDSDRLMNTSSIYQTPSANISDKQNCRCSHNASTIEKQRPQSYMFVSPTKSKPEQQVSVDINANCSRDESFIDVDNTPEATVSLGNGNSSFLDDSAQDFLLWKERLSNVGSVHLPHESLQDELDKVRSSEQREESPISVRQYEEQILELQEMLGDKQNIIDCITKNIAEKTEHINKLENSLLLCGAKCDEQISNLSTQILTLSERSAKVESLMLEKELHSDNLQFLLNEQVQKNEATRAELKEKTFELHKTKLTLETMQISNDVENENQRLLNEIRTLEETNASMQESLDIVNAERSKLLTLFWQAQGSEKMDNQTSCEKCEALKTENNELHAKIASLEEKSSKKRFEKLQISKDKLMSKYEDLEEQIKSENLRYERVVAENVALVLRHKQEVKKLENELDDVTRLADYGRCHSAEEVDRLERQIRILEEKLIQTQRENDNLVKTRNSETIVQGQEQANMLKKIVELESKFNEASKVLGRSEEGLITTKNLLANAPVIVDGSGDSLNSMVSSEEIKQMKSKEKSLRQVLSLLLFRWKTELEALPNASHLVQMLSDNEKACFTCSVDASMTETCKINHLIHLSIDTFNAFCQMKDVSLLPPTLDVAVQTLSPQGKFGNRSWFLYDSPDSPSEAAGFDCAMHIPDTQDSASMDVAQALTNYDNITAFNVLTSSNIEVDHISQTLSELELTKTVDNLLVTSITNVTTIEDICRKKENVKEELEGQFHVEIRKLLVILKDLQELCREVAVHDPITHCLQQLDSIVRLSLRLANLAAQCGALQEEQRSSTSTNLLIKYTLMLKQKLEQPPSHQPFIHINEGYTSEATRVARQLPQLNAAAPFDIEEEANEVADKIVPFSFHRSSDARKQVARPNGSRGGSIRTCMSLMCKVLSALSMLFLVLFLFIIYKRYDDLRYVPWDRILSPYIKFTRRGPPPV